MSSKQTTVKTWMKRSSRGTCTPIASISGEDWRAVKARAYRLAAAMVEASEGYSWAVEVDECGAVWAETESGLERDAIPALAMMDALLAAESVR